MMATDPVWCLVIDCDKKHVGEPFEVSGAKNIAELKEKAKEKKSSRLQGIDADELIVWRCNDMKTPFDFRNIEAGMKKFFDKGVDKLYVDQTIAELGLSKKEVLLVQVLLAALPQSPALPELQSFWDSLWNAPSTDSIPLLTRRDVARDGTLEEYRIETSKRWTLQVPAVMAQSFELHTKIVLMRNDYMEALRGLFDSIGWKSSHIPKDLDSADTFINPFLIRTPDTDSMMGGAFVLTGHPGIGKTTWLFLILVLRLHAKLPTIVQFLPSKLYVFTKTGARIIEKNPHQVMYSLATDFPLIWALVDSNDDLTTVNSVYSAANVFVIQTPSPRAHRLEWRKKASTVTTFILKPWTMEELICARSFQRNIHSEILLYNFYHRYGPSARHAYNYAALPETYGNLITSDIKHISYNTLYQLIDDADSFNLNYQVSHSIIIMHPSTDRQPEIHFASDHIARLIMGRLGTTTRTTANKLYLTLIRNPHTKKLGWDLLDNNIHEVIPARSYWRLSPMEKSPRTGTKNQHWKSPKLQSDTDVQFSYLCINSDGFVIQSSLPTDIPVSSASASTTNVIESHPFHWDKSVVGSGYYYPMKKTQETFDAFLYDAEAKHVVLLQATVGDEHDVKLGGIKQLKELEPTTLTYIVVTPPDVEVDLKFPHDVEPMVNGGRYQLQVDSLIEPTG